MDSILGGERWNEAIVDVAPRNEDGILDESLTEQSIALCHKLARDAEAHVTVYTKMSRPEWLERTRGFGPELARLEFYSKANLEIPPLLKGIEGIILGNPLSIGVNIASLVPDDIRHEWIEARDTKPLYALLIEYVRRQVVSAHLAEVEIPLPKGLLMLWHVINLESEIGNGGFVQYFGNQIDGELGWPTTGVGPTIQSLRHMGAIELADLVSEGFPISELLRVVESRTAEERVLIDQLEGMNKRFYDLDWSYVPEIEKYARTHPEEFVDRQGWRVR
jgi:hypothetical protein